MAKKKFTKKAKTSPQKVKLVEGEVRINQRGFGFFHIRMPRESYLISHHDVAGLMDGDKISCALKKRNGKIFAQPIRMLQRAHKSLIGRLIKTDRRIYFEAQGNFPRPRFVVVKPHEKDWTNLSNDTLFRAEIVNYPTSEKVGDVRLSCAIGIAGTLSTQIALLLSESDVSTQFAPQVLEQAAGFKENPLKSDMKNRKDLTPLSFCTIDGETAKDFDDAIFAQKEKDKIQVRVAIADVSFYVRAGSEIDKEAYTRGTSLYFPGSCVPMIPEHLSNGLCSLKPNVPRLVMVADFLVDKSGSLTKTRFYRATITSKARLTYRQVQAHFDGEDVSLIQEDKHLIKSLKQVHQASKWLRKARQKRGAIDFDSVESHIALNDSGEPISIHPEQRLDSHKVIEDLMIAANEAVARFIEEKEAPCIYRVHEAPDPEKFQVFLTLAQKLGLIKPKEMPKGEDLQSPKFFSSILNRVREHQAKEALEMLFLRSMMQARYDLDNVGHFGLASTSYLHFTSPIRRYPDLLVHRVLEQFLDEKGKAKKVKIKINENLVMEMAQSLSEKERRVIDAERNITALFSCWYMKDKVGEQDEGVIVSCTEFGVFVRLNRFRVDGLLHVASMGGYFDYDPESMRLVEQGSKKSYSIGDKVHVKVSNVNIERRHIDLEFIGTNEKKKRARN